MKYFKKLIGERIYLSPMCIDDAEKYVEWFCDFKTADGIGKSGGILSIESEKEWINKTLLNNEFIFSIVNIENDELIGNCGINQIDQKNRAAEIGIFIGNEEDRNKGYGKEALNILLDYGFNYLNLNNIQLGVFSFNERAIACYKKVGFKEYGRRRKCYFLNGKYYDKVYMDILAEEFKGNYIKNKNV